MAIEFATTEDEDGRLAAIDTSEAVRGELVEP